MYNFSQLSDLERQINKFWNIEEFDNETKINKTDVYCENLFKSTLSRNVAGRFVVQRPSTIREYQYQVYCNKPLKIYEI